MLLMDSNFGHHTCALIEPRLRPACHSAQFFENGTTHVLSAGVQLVASFGTTKRTFPVKEVKSVPHPHSRPYFFFFFFFTSPVITAA